MSLEVLLLLKKKYKCFVIILLLTLCLFAQKTFAQTFSIGGLIVEQPQGTNSDAHPIRLLEYSPAGGFVTGVPLPVSTGGIVNGITESGASSSAAQINLSEDGRYITVPGYDVSFSTPHVVSLDSNRVVAKVDVNGNTTTIVLFGHSEDSLNLDWKSNFQSVITDNGTGYWLGGTTGGIPGDSTDGIKYAYNNTFSSTIPQSSSPVVTPPSITSENIRAVKIFGGQLYYSTQGLGAGIYSVGTGAPTGSGNAATLVFPLASSNQQPTSFVILPVSGPTPGVNYYVAYVADNGPVAGVYKYYFDGTTWMPRGAYTPSGGNIGFYGLTGAIPPGNFTGNVQLYATDSTGTIYMFTDASHFPNPMVIAASPTLVPGGSFPNRYGIAFAPLINPVFINNPGNQTFCGTGALDSILFNPYPGSVSSVSGENWVITGSTIGGLPDQFGTGSSIYFTPTSNGTATLTAYSYYGDKMTTPVTLTITVGTASSASFTTSPGPSSCTNTPITYTTQPGYSTYMWGVPGILGTDYIILSGGIDSADSTVTLEWLTTGSKAVSVNYITPCGSTAPAMSNTFVNMSPIDTLASAVGTDNQVICIGSTIVNIVYNTAPPSAVPVVSGLPSGVTYSTTFGATRIITISGTPTTPGIYPYSVFVPGSPCSTTATGTITVNSLIATPTFTVYPTPPTCSNTVVTYKTQPGYTGYAWGFPGSVLGTDYIILSGGTSTDSTLTLEWLTYGAKSVSINYIGCGGSYGTPDTTTTNVAALPTAMLASGIGSDNQVICIGTPISTIKYNVFPPASIVTVSGLPSGVTYIYTPGNLKIMGTPTVSGTFVYTATIASAPCSIIITGTITVNSLIAMPTFTMYPTPPTCSNTPITYKTQPGYTGYAWGFPGSTLGTDYIILSGGTSTDSTLVLEWLTYGAKGVSINYIGCGGSYGTPSTTVTNVWPSPTIGLASPIGTDSQTVCSGTLITNIKYNISPPSSTVSVTGLPAGIIGSYSPGTLVIHGSSTVTGIFPYTVTATNGTCTATATGTIIIGNVWTGAVNSNWSIVGNWSCGVVPTATTDALIPNVPHQPKLSASTSFVRNLIMLPLTNVTLANHIFEIDGSFSGSSTAVLRGSALSTLSIKGTADTLYFDNAANTLFELEIFDTASGTLGTPLHIASGGVVNVGTVSGGTLNSNGNLTLISDDNGSAMIGELPMDIFADTCLSKINGNVNVQCYVHSIYSAMPAPRRAWRLITAPISNYNAVPVDSIYSSWQNNGVYAPGVGTLITGPPSVVTSANGLDSGINSSYSMDSFNVSAQSLPNVNNTKIPISGSSGNADNKGYFIFIRGDRTPATVNNPAFAPVNNTTLTCTGTLQTGDQVFSTANGKISSLSGGFALIGNPYASPIDFSLIAGDPYGILTMTNMVNRFYTWDANLTGSSGVGGYVTIDDPGFSGTYTKSLGGVASAADLSIQSGQAVFVETNLAGPASIKITEADKTVTPNYIFRPSNNNGDASLKGTLSLLNPDNSISLTDGWVAAFNDNYCACVDYMDAAKFGNVDEMFALSRSGKTLAIERRPTIQKNDTLFISIANMTQRSYQLGFTAGLLNNSGLTATLVDNYLNTRTPLDLSGGTTKVNFAVSSASASKVSNRFMVVFTAPVVLPVTFTGIKAAQHGPTIGVQWAVENELNIKEYEVQKLINGIFTTIGTVAANGASVYSFTDSNEVTGSNVYRIASTNIDGSPNYSGTADVAISTTGKSGIAAHINPVKSGEDIQLDFTNMSAGNYGIQLINSLGQVIVTSSVSHAAGSSTESISSTKYLAAGDYQLQVLHPDKTATTINLVVSE